MGFLNKVERYILEEFGGNFNDYKYAVIDGKIFYLEGHTGINLLGNNNISFHIKNKILQIEGMNLIVKYLDNSTSVIEGEIFKVELK